MKNMDSIEEYDVIDLEQDLLDEKANTDYLIVFNDTVAVFTAVIAYKLLTNNQFNDDLLVNFLIQEGVGILGGITALQSIKNSILLHMDRQDIKDKIKELKLK